MIVTENYNETIQKQIIDQEGQTLFERLILEQLKLAITVAGYLLLLLLLLVVVVVVVLLLSSS